jgi:hypothetical protein
MIHTQTEYSSQSLYLVNDTIYLIQSIYLVNDTPSLKQSTLSPGRQTKAVQIQLILCEKLFCRS